MFPGKYSKRRQLRPSNNSNNFKVTSSNWLRVINLKKTREALDVFLSSKICRKAFTNNFSDSGQKVIAVKSAKVCFQKCDQHLV